MYIFEHNSPKYICLLLFEIKISYNSYKFILDLLMCSGY